MGLCGNFTKHIDKIWPAKVYSILNYSVTLETSALGLNTLWWHLQLIHMYDFHMFIVTSNSVDKTKFPSAN